MSEYLLEFARRFSTGELRAANFADQFIKRWKNERDDGIAVVDPHDISERLSTIFCLADLYNPLPDRAEYELDDAALLAEVRRALAI